MASNDTGSTAANPAEDDEGPSSPDERAEELGAGDDAMPVCLRCFGPLAGAPTVCPSCGAPASHAARLGPTASGIVEIGGRNLTSLPRAGADGGLTPWGVAIVWGLGGVLLPWVLALVMEGMSFAGADVNPVWLVVLFGVWTVVLLPAFLAARRRVRAAAREGRSAPDSV